MIHQDTYRAHRARAVIPLTTLPAPSLYYLDRGICVVQLRENNRNHIYGWMCANMRLELFRNSQDQLSRGSRARSVKDLL